MCTTSCYELVHSTELLLYYSGSALDRLIFQNSGEATLAVALLTFHLLL